MAIRRVVLTEAYTFSGKPMAPKKYGKRPISPTVKKQSKPSKLAKPPKAPKNPLGFLTGKPLFEWLQK